MQRSPGKLASTLPMASVLLLSADALLSMTVDGDLLPTADGSNPQASVLGVRGASGKLASTPPKAGVSAVITMLAPLLFMRTRLLIGLLV